MSDNSETRQKCGANRSMVTDCFTPMVTQMATIKVCVQLISTFELQGKFFVFPDTHTHTTPPSSARSSSHTIWGITLSTPYIISLIRGLRHPTHAIWNLYRHRWETLDSAIRTGRVLILDPNRNTDGVCAVILVPDERWQTFYRTQNDHISYFFWMQWFKNTWKCVLPT